MTDAEPRLMTPHLRRYDTEIAAATHRHRRHRVDKMLVGSWLPTGFGVTTYTDTHPDHHGGWVTLGPRWAGNANTARPNTIDRDTLTP